MSNLEMYMNQIADWMFMFGDESTTIQIGIWSFEDSPHTYYAVIKNGDDLVCGESSYGSGTIEEALSAVVSELS